MSKIILALSLLLLVGCGLDSIYTVTCEGEYFKGKAKRAWTNKNGTNIMLFDGAYIRYPPSVKCEVIIK